MKTLIVIAGVLLAAACETQLNDNEFPNSVTLNTEDITTFGHYLNLEDNSFVDPYDIVFRKGPDGYQIVLNSSAGVRALSADNSTFDSAVLPLAPFSGDTVSVGYYAIGTQWMDESTYNPNDHSVQGNGSVWFLRTTDYKIVKFEPLMAQPDSVLFRYAFQTDNGFGAVITKTIGFRDTSDTPFDFTTEQVTDSVPWDIAFYTLPVFVPEMGNLYMPHIALNTDVQVAILTEGNFEEITNLPTQAEWWQDNDTTSVLGYLGEFMVLVYHPEPPYNHKVIIEHPEYIYLLQTEHGAYRLQFEEYGSGALIFALAQIGE